MRVGVVLRVPDPAATEIQGLRRACGDRALDRVPPHVTLIPPLNLAEDRLPDAGRVLRAAAATVRPFVLELGPAGTFLPVTPVLRLDVGGPGLDVVHRLRDAVFADPLTRTIDHPFVPHVTLSEESTPERIAAGVVALADYRATVTIDRVHLMQEGADRIWQPVADAALGPAEIRGRGGVELEFTVTAVPAPDARPWAGPGADEWTVTARRDGAAVGVARSRTRSGTTFLDHVEVVPGQRGLGVGSRLVAAVETEARERGSDAVVSALPAGCDAFLQHLGWSPAEARRTMVRRLSYSGG